MVMTGDYRNGNSEQLKEEPVSTSSEQDLSSNIRHSRTYEDTSSQPDDKRIPRNKVCPCGSKKKYKACCGSVAERSSTKLIINPAVESKKGRKEKKVTKKGGSAKSTPSSELDGGPPDMGALCI